MKAFLKNIDALEIKTKVFIQKWKETQLENQQIVERNKKLEEENERHNALDLDQDDHKTNLKSESNANLSQIQQALDHYIERLDACIELLNIELNGK